MPRLAAVDWNTGLEWHDVLNNSSHYGVANVSRRENVNEIITNMKCSWKDKSKEGGVTEQQETWEKSLI